MKKSYLMIAAVALFAACASNDTFKEVDVQDVPIGFNGNFVNNTTRAEISTDWMQQDGKQFGVYGYKTLDATTTDLFINEPVTYSGSESDWTHPTVRFWDKGASNAYYFYAYAPYKNDGTMTWTSTGFQFTDIPIIKKINPTATSDADDIVVANAQEGFDYQDCSTSHAGLTHTHEGFVPFTFNHILSKLCFKVKTDIEKSSAVFTVKKIEIDFPSMASGKSVSWTQGAKNNVITGVTAYGSTNADYVNYDGSWDNDLKVYDNATGFEVEADASLPNGTSLAEYIVTPVNSTVTKHAFAVKVTYDVQYKQVKEGSKSKDPSELVYPTDYEDVTNGLEPGCIATGIIDTKFVDDDNDSSTPEVEVPVYTPGCNDKWIITIDIEPDRIDFCVDKVNGWDTPVHEEIVEVE